MPFCSSLQEAFKEWNDEMFWRHSKSDFFSVRVSASSLKIVYRTSLLLIFGSIVQKYGFGHGNAGMGMMRLLYY